ncbi:gamma-glutamylcyclotransferase family protein [Marinicrinis sediminis]|uniref:Gamma-glutamylcyclotransferase n=1 Tax=Marinicrinis sediminis TaxID=1652465 RepID=A0ABW5R8C3_9BACL
MATWQDSVVSVFVYGTLLQGECNHHLVNTHLRALEAGQIYGTLVHLGPYPGLLLLDEEKVMQSRQAAKVSEFKQTSQETSLAAQTAQNSQARRISQQTPTLQKARTLHASSAKGIVHGEWLTLNKEALSVLDALEDYFGPAHPDNEYDRVWIQDVSRAREGWVYVWRAHRHAPLIPSGSWRRRSTAHS